MNPPGRLARPLLPLTLAYIGGLIAARLGLDFPLPGLAAAGVALLILLGLTWWGRKAGGILALALFWLCGLGGYHLASAPPPAVPSCGPVTPRAAVPFHRQPGQPAPPPP